MQHVDALSRSPIENTICDSKLEYLPEIFKLSCSNIVNNVDHKCVFNVISEDDEILSYQYLDEELSKKKEILAKQDNKRTAREKGEVENYVCKNNILFKKLGKRELYVVPKTMRKSLVVRFHDLNGHPGVERTLEIMSRKYYFPNMRRYVKQHVYMCFQCLATKTKRGPQPGELHPIPPGSRPFHTVNIDHVGPFVNSGKINKYILVIIDNLTKFVKLVPAKNTKAIGVIRALEDFVLDFGAPVKIISDQGTCFKSNLFKDFCQKHGIIHVKTSPRHPQANGQVERVNSTLIPMLQAVIKKENGKDWDLRVKEVQCYLNELKNATLNLSPFEALFGFYPSHNEGEIRKLTVDPFVITKICGNDTYVICSLKNSNKINSTTAHITQMKLWHPMKNYVGDNECDSTEYVSD